MQRAPLPQQSALDAAVAAQTLAQATATSAATAAAAASRVAAEAATKLVLPPRLRQCARCSTSQSDNAIATIVEHCLQQSRQRRRSPLRLRPP